MYYYSLLLTFSIAVFVPEQLVFVSSISFVMDDLDSLPLVFDNTPSSFLFTDDDDDEVSITTTTTAETLPNFCATVVPPNDLSFTQEEDTNLFSRRRRDSSNPACLPPVKIGAETLHLFENPLDTLENTLLLPPNGQNPLPLDTLENMLLLPLDGPEKNSDDSSGSPGGGLSSEENEKQGNDDNTNLNAQGWRIYRGEVHYEEPAESKTCKELTAHRGNFNLELCCMSLYAGKLPFSPDRYYLEDYELVDAWTRSNEDYAAVYICARTFLSKNSLPTKK